MVPDEVTVTVIQGRGTALYTPLEQYGGDTGHTDPRSDIYAFSATFYHLLTNRSPAEAKRRFLRPQELIPPSEINPAIPASVEQALLWGMALHPDERPQSIGEMRAAMEGATTLSQASAELSFPQQLERLLPTDLDRGLAAAALFLAAIAAAASLL
jgi:serine/threonine-protein kinase